MTDNEKILLAELEQKLGYTFNDKSILIRALTHKSAIVDAMVNQHYQRLEFLGDSILNFLVAKYLFNSSKFAEEGELTTRRAQVVSKEPLAKIFDQLILGKYILRSKKMEVSGKTKSDFIESIIGAMFVDNKDIVKGIEVCDKFVKKHILANINCQGKTDGIRFVDYTSKFLEYAVNEGITHKINVVRIGPSHETKHQVTLYIYNIKGKQIGKYVSNQKPKIKEAQHDAFKKACMDFKLI